MLHASTTIGRARLARRWTRQGRLDYAVLRIDTQARRQVRKGSENMTARSWRGLTVISSIVLALSVDAIASGSPVAIVCTLRGAARVSEDGGQGWRALKLYDLLADQSTIAAGGGATVRMAFADGALYELAGEGQAVMSAGGPTSDRGECRLIARNPAVNLAPVLKRAGEERVIAAIRVRSSRTCPTAALPTRAILRPCVDIDRAAYTFFHFVVSDRALKEVYSTDSAHPQIIVPVLVVRPGEEYVWSMTGREGDKATPLVQDEKFRIVSSEELRVREPLRSAYSSTKDTSWLLLLARWDADIGLTREACEELEEASRLDPTDTGIKESLDPLRCTD